MKTFVVLCVIFAVAAAAAPGARAGGKPEDNARNKRHLYSLGYPYTYSAYPAYTPQVVSYSSLLPSPHVVVRRVYHLPAVSHVVHHPTYTAPTILYK